MPHHIIRSKEDIQNLIDRYDDGLTGIFEVLETGEELTLPDLLHMYDGQVITIQHI